MSSPPPRVLPEGEDGEPFDRKSAYRGSLTQRSPEGRRGAALRSFAVGPPAACAVGPALRPVGLPVDSRSSEWRKRGQSHTSRETRTI